MAKSDEGKTVSYWEATGDLSEKNSLVQSIETDVCIIGAGISGLTTAYLLMKVGKRVIVIDDGVIGGGETCRTTAHLSNALDDRIDAATAPEAHALARIEAASYRLQLGRLDETQAAISDSTRALDNLTSVNSTVHAALYRVSGDFHKVGRERHGLLTATGSCRIRRLLQDLAALPRVRRRRHGPLGLGAGPARPRSQPVGPARCDDLQLWRARTHL